MTRQRAHQLPVGPEADRGRRQLAPLGDCGPCRRTRARIRVRRQVRLIPGGTDPDFSPAANAPGPASGVRQLKIKGLLRKGKVSVSFTAPAPGTLTLVLTASGGKAVSAKSSVALKR